MLSLGTDQREDTMIATSSGSTPTPGLDRVRFVSPLLIRVRF
jgi:hypothetical protein